MISKQQYLHLKYVAQ